MLFLLQDACRSLCVLVDYNLQVILKSDAFLKNITELTCALDKKRQGHLSVTSIATTQAWARIHDLKFVFVHLVYNFMSSLQ